MTQACNTPLPAQTRVSLAATLGAAATSLLTLIAAAWRRRRNRKAVSGLLDLDDYMLADIGVTRSDVAASLHGSDYLDPSAQLARLRNERRISSLSGRRRRGA
ncbi:DUF1127 domain-containing protein [Stappia sp. TSB10GB4]|uniref:DUF1127 domain-containing protein n=1 Tax=Stappia sp. TSB10GB4 TaxID=2003584 RepID=UPI001647B1C7|nr:DUF1127 domain-containing protein [Stappia sp. TSB10GB4]